MNSTSAIKQHTLQPVQPAGMSCLYLSAACRDHLALFAGLTLVVSSEKLGEPPT
jgi:hypothetical protein